MVDARCYTAIRTAWHQWFHVELRAGARSSLTGFSSQATP